MSALEKLPYPARKEHELSDQEKQQIRARIESGDNDTQLLAREFRCATSQIAGLKAHMTRKQ